MFRIRTAIKTGRKHLQNGMNCQDALRVIEEQEVEIPYVIAVACDGCSDGKFSEVGANLGATFLATQAYYYLTKGIKPLNIGNLLYQDLISAMKNFLDQFKFRNDAEKALFVKEHMLFTAMGVVITKDEGIIFASGDGVITLNDESLFREQDNKPIYIGYNLVDIRFFTTSVQLPNGFDLIHLDIKNISKLAIGSDAWKEEPEFLKEVWGFNHPRGLQRKLNVWSNENHLFKDDVSIITVEKV